MDTNPITFGTDGWRGVISREVTFDSMALLARAVARVVGSGSSVLVGYDTRFLSPEYGQLVTRVLLDEGVDAALISAPCPTPALSWAVARRGARAGLMITASHNPPVYNGIKVKSFHGGPASPDVIGAIVAAARDLQLSPVGEMEPGRHIPLFDPVRDYLKAVTDMVNLDAIRRLAGRTVVVDAFHGSAAGYLPRLLDGTGVKVVEIRGERNPGFGGVAPEPRGDTAGPLGRAVNDCRACLGLMFDGDGDRLVAWAEPLGFIHPQHVFVLLLDHLARGRGQSGAVVRTSAVTSLVDRLAETLGLPIVRKPVGFGHVCEEMLDGDVLIGGEEAGGFGFQGHVPDRDGLVAALLLLEMMGSTGASLSERLTSLFSELGRLHYDRVDIQLDSDAAAGLATRLQRPPATIAGLKVESVDTGDGLRLGLEDSSWLLIRTSGTEPLVRIYGEAPATSRLRAILHDGTALAYGRDRG